MYDEEIEKAVLYYIIFEKEQLQINEKDFIDARNKRIAKAIIELRKEKEDVSLITVQNKIKANKAQVIEYISHLGDNLFGTNLEQSFNKLKELTQKRELFNLYKTSLEEIENQDNVDLFIQDNIKKLNDIAKKDLKDKQLIDQIVETVQEIENNYNQRNDYSLYTGIYDLDDLTCGLHNKELTIIGARPRGRKNNINFANC